MHFDVVFDIGLDYGADGGLAWDTQVIHFPSGASRRNERRSQPLGQWQLGNRDIDADTLSYLQGFLHAMRGRAHSFLYRDWNDYRVIEQQLVLDGSASGQLIKAYGLAINAWLRNITKPDAASLVIEYDSGAGFAALTAGVDYTLDAATGGITWLLDPLPAEPSVARWSGEFWVPVRFDRDVLSAQFLGLERRTAGDELAYSIGALSVVEEPDA